MNASTSFLDFIGDVPRVPDKEAAQAGSMAFEAAIRQLQDITTASKLREVAAHPSGQALLACIFSYSPFLSRLIMRNSAFFVEICERGPQPAFNTLKAAFEKDRITDILELMRSIRVIKARASLLIAVADITHAWALADITGAMSEVAGLCIRAALSFLLKRGHDKGEIVLPDEADCERDCGLFVLAMGKLGAYELNYSSDIDLIVFFDSQKVAYTGTQNAQHFFSRLTQELVRLIQERTRDGYGFRVDLRLRPDPASTPLALSTAAAITYYETVGQNWERAALIKARVVAGDAIAGTHFLTQIAPFLWRKHLDFAAINDIQSIKRQMDAKASAHIAVEGHNIKTGLGGIREIEFFAQIHQLIWGGRIRELRERSTCEVLSLLAQHGLIASELNERLSESYHFLRHVEHRLQMIDDQQTHTIPASPDLRAKLAGFAGFVSLAAFEEALLAHLHFVHEQFAEVFQGPGSLSGEEGKLSFTGVENDPQTLHTLQKMGYQNPASVSSIIQAWHHGARRSTRTQRARELITELTPSLLRAFAATLQPDQAFMHFDAFLTALPAGVPIFSLFHANPQLLELLALIMGAAPAMAQALSKNPQLLDVVLMREFSQKLQDSAALATRLDRLLDAAQDFEGALIAIRRFRNECQFQAGIELMRREVNGAQVNSYLSDMAELCIQRSLEAVESNFQDKFAAQAPGDFAVIALGRLGARELTFGSDLDLVFVYADTQDESESGRRHVFYNKLGQRFLSSLTALTKEGRLYEVDTRLRPSGKEGALAISVTAFDKYFSESAWTFEYMALTRARVITGSESLRRHLGDVIMRHVLTPRVRGTLAYDIRALRDKVSKEFRDDNIWDIKHVRGGFMDMDFIAQYFVLAQASEMPSLWQTSSARVFEMLQHHQLLAANIAHDLLEAHRFLTELSTLLRLCGGVAADERTAGAGFRQLIAAHLGMKDFDQVKTTLMRMLARNRHYFDTLLPPSQSPAPAL